MVRMCTRVGLLEGGAYLTAEMNFLLTVVLFVSEWLEASKYVLISSLFVHVTWSYPNSWWRLLGDCWWLTLMTSQVVVTCGKEVSAVCLGVPLQWPRITVAILRLGDMYPRLGYFTVRCRNTLHVSTDVVVYKKLCNNKSPLSRLVSNRLGDLKLVGETLIIAFAGRREGQLYSPR